MTSLPSMPPRLLAIGALPPPVNGLSKAFGIAVEGLANLGWSVEVVDVADRSPPRRGSSFSWARARSVVIALGQVVRRVPRADVVYVTISQSRLGFAKDALAIRWAAALGRPVVVHMHGGNFKGFYETLGRCEQRVVTGALRRVATMIVLTESLKADFAMTPGWQDRTVAIANTCDVVAGSPRRAPSDEVRLLFLSALIASKGYREAVAAGGELARRRPALRVLIDVAGGLSPGADFPSREAQAEDLRLRIAALPPNAQATVHGEVDPVRKQELLAAAHMLVLPTHYLNEGQPIAIIEALTAGLPVVATDWRGIRETLPSSLHPLLVPSPDPLRLADRLESLLDDPAWFEGASRAALAHAESFRPERHLRAIDDVLRQAWSGP